MKWGWIVAACLLAGWAAARRHRQSRRLQAAELAVVAGALLVGTGVIHLPKLEKLLEDTGSALGSWTYLLVGALAFAETGAFLGFIAPGETAVIVGGLVAGQGRISLFVLIAITWACAVAGDLTSFTLGRRLGRAWLLRHGERLHITEDKLEKVEGFFDRRGGATILIGRFIGLVRAVAPFTAGASRLPLRGFLPWSLLGTAVWVSAFTLVGYVFSSSFSAAAGALTHGALALAVVAAVVVAVRARRRPGPAPA